jgi:Mechanosensitive ion channel, conserved TM helix
MGQVSLWIEQWKAATGELFHAFLLYLPNLLGALLVLLAGWAVARIGQTAVVRLVRGLNQVLARIFAEDIWVRIRLSENATNIIGNVVFWLILVFSVTAAAKIAKFEFFALWLDRMLAYLPSLLAGALIAFVGYLVSNIVRDVVTATFSMAGTRQSRLLGLLAQSATVLIALVVGLDQAGIDVGFIVTMVSILVGAVAATFTIAFGFGSRGFVGNMIGVYQMQRHLRPGQQVRIGDTTGEILELTPTGVVLATEEGRTLLPGNMFNEESVNLLTPDREHE